MERLTGSNLKEVLLEKQTYSEEEAKEFMRQILEAVKFCHEHAVCHADLKPANILQANSQNDTIKILDFGEAFEVPNIGPFKNRGTPAYQAPEIVIESVYGTPVDVWACGVISECTRQELLKTKDYRHTFFLVFYLLTGNLPFVTDFTSPNIKDVILETETDLLVCIN